MGAYLPTVHARWLAGDPASDWAMVDGTLVFADVSGFTPLSERLARLGKAGAEELTDIVNQVMGGLLDVATPLGGDMIKHGGDALLLLFTGDGHEARAAAAAAGMLVAMRQFRGYQTSAGRVTLRMSIGADVGPFLLCLAGRTFRELVIIGPAVSRVAALEAAAAPGEVLLGPALAAALPAPSRGPSRDGGIRLRRAPSVEPVTESAERWPARVLLPGVPTALRDHLGTIRDGEHRQAAVSFVQFLGTDDLLEAEGPEALVAVIDELVTTAEEACTAHGVTFLTTDLDRNAGKLLLLCGAPTTAADDEDRLVSAVRTILDGDHRLAVRAGVNRGRVFALEVGTEARRVYTVTGDTVNLAARVTGKAPLGACLATSAVVERLVTDYNLGSVEPFRVKGKSAPITAALVGSAVGSRTSGIPVVETPLVGRLAERQLLLDAIADAQAGKLRVIELIGEPGIGKSRLIAELCANAADTMPIIVVEASQYAATTPYRAVRDAARTMLGLTSYETDDVVARQLTDSVRAVAPQLEPWLPLLAVAFGISLPDTPETAALAPSHRRDRLQETVSAFLGATLPPAGVLVIEDAYWLDEASGELLTHLIRTLLPRLHWVVCAARRGVPTALDLTGLPGVTKVELGPLSPEDAAAILALGGTELARAEAAAMVDRSGGNPLFLQELARAAARGATVEELPDTVEALVAAHIDTLAPVDRTLLRTASVLGVHFPKGLLVDLASQDKTEALAGVRRLREWLLSAGAGRLRFRHGLLREVAYEGLAIKRRRDLHSRAADLIQAYAGDDVASAAEPLSLHYFAAGRHLEAWDWSRVAGDRARRSAAPVEAATFFERALESARHAGIEPAAVAETQEALGDVCELGGRYDRAATAYAQARRLLAGDDVSIANLLRKQGWVSERAGRYRDALRWYTRGFKAVEAVEASAAAGRLKAELYLAYGAVRMRQGRHREAVPLLEEAVRQAEALGALHTLAHAYYDLDWAWTELGSPDPRYRELALPIYEELGDWQGQGNTLNNLGLGAYYEGRWDEGLRSWQRAREAFEKAGDVVQMATIANNVGEILSDQGHLPDAEREFGVALATWREAEFRVGIGLATSNLGRAAARAGRFDEAESLLASALEQLKAIGAAELALEAEAREAERLVLSGDHAGALARAEAVRPLATRPTLVAQVERTIGYAWAQRADVTTARRWLEQSLATAEQVGATFEIAVTRMALVQVNRIGGDHLPPDPVAASIFDRLGVVWTPVPPLPGAAPVLSRT